MLSFRAQIGKFVASCIDTYDRERQMSWDDWREAARSLSHPVNLSNIDAQADPLRRNGHEPV
jgi:hypothetical protein